MEAQLNNTTLRHVISKHFSLDDLKIVCTDAGIDPETVPYAERGKDIYALFVVETFRRKDKLSDLRRECAKARPNLGINWSELPIETTVPAEWAELLNSQKAQQYFQQILAQHGGLNFGQGNSIEVGGDVFRGDKVRGNKIDARDSQGFVYQPSGPVEQHFGTRIDTGGGDYVGGDKAVTNNYGYTPEQVAVLIGQIRKDDQPRVWDGRAPYVGLAAFEEEDAAIFFGRERLVEAMIEQIRPSASLAVFGPSGSGKSSVIRAGLLVALKRGVLDGSDKWLYATMMPGSNPIEQLAKALSAMALKAGFARSISDDLRINGLMDSTVLATLASALTQGSLTKRLVIFVDQFEESFTLTHDETVKAAFFDLLTTAINHEEGRVKVILSARSDFLSQCAGYPDLRRMINQQFRLIGAMEPEEMARAIVMPAIQVGAHIQPELVSFVISETQGDPGMLPLLQFALKDLFDSRSPRVGSAIELTLDDYTARGGMRQVLDRRAEDTFKALSVQQQGIARQIFSGLIEVGRGTVDTRRKASIAELIPVGVNPSEVVAVIQALSNGRLLTTTTDAEGATGLPDQAKGMVTIVHERLIDAWPWLRRLVDDNRKTIARQNEINDEAKQWNANRRDASYLYLGARLQVLQEELKADHLVLAELAQAFVGASIAEQARRNEEVRQQEQERLHVAQRLAETERKSGNRLRGFLAVVTVVALVAVGLAGLAIWQTDQAQMATTREQSAKDDALTAKSQAETNLLEAKRQRTEAEHQRILGRSREVAALVISQIVTGQDPERALLLAMEAVTVTHGANTPHTFEAEEALRQALFLSFIRPRIRAHLSGHENWVTSAQFSPDGTSIVTASADNTARVWEAATGKQSALLSGHESSVDSAQFSPDGTSIVTASFDNTVRVWETATGKQTALLSGHEDRVTSAQFSPDGTFIVTASADKTARVWEAATGKQSALLSGHESSVLSAQFSPDGKSIVTASFDNTVRIYLVRIKDLMALAQSRVTRLLSCKERVKYLNESLDCGASSP